MAVEGCEGRKGDQSTGYKMPPMASEQVKNTTLHQNILLNCAWIYEMKTHGETLRSYSMNRHSGTRL